MRINITAAALTVGLVWGVLGMLVTGVGQPPRTGIRSGAAGRDGVGLPWLHGDASTVGQVLIGTLYGTALTEPSWGPCSPGSTTPSPRVSGAEGAGARRRNHVR